MKLLVTQSDPTLCDPMDCRPLGSSVHGILQARTLEWAAWGFFLTRSVNPGLLHLRQILYCLSHQGLPGFMKVNFETFRKGGQRDSGPESQGGALPGMRGASPLDPWCLRGCCFRPRVPSPAGQRNGYVPTACPPASWTLGERRGPSERAVENFSGLLPSALARWALP